MEGPARDFRGRAGGAGAARLGGMEQSTGPLAGVKIIEMTGIGPVPYAAMVLADLGAQVIRIDRPGGYPSLGDGLDFSAMTQAAIFYRSRPMVQVDLKSQAGRDLILRLAGDASALIEGYRPGTMERLGLGPDACHARNPALAYVRVTGWGQDGPMAGMAGHDLNYLGLSGVLSLFGRDGAPPRGMPPLVGDMAGGALFAVIGLLSAVMQARATGTGQMVDANIVDGSANLASLVTALGAVGTAGAAMPGAGPLDGARHFYRTYQCADGEWLVVGAIEPAFRKVLLSRLGLESEPRMVAARPEDDAHCADVLARIFRQKPRDHWVALFDGSDGCVTPVLSQSEAAAHPANRARDVFTRIDGVTQPAPAPRLSRTPGAIGRSPAEAARPDTHALSGWGLSEDDVSRLREQGAFGSADDDDGAA